MDDVTHRRRTLVFMVVSGLAGGGLLGYFSFGRSIVYGVVLGLGFAAILGYRGWATTRGQPVGQPPASPRPPRIRARKALMRLAILFLPLAVAAAAGAATHSEQVFVIVVAAGAALELAYLVLVAR